MNWTDIRKMLKIAPNDVLIEIIKGLFKLSPQNKAGSYVENVLQRAI